MNAWSRFWFTPGPASTLGFCRMLFFTGLCLWQIPHDYSPWGAYSSVLWMPIWLFDEFNVPLLPPIALDVIQTVWKLSLILGAIGLFTRAASIVAFGLGIYLMGLPHNFGQTQHFDTLWWSRPDGVPPNGRRMTASTRGLSGTCGWPWPSSSVRQASRS
jgi:hypothetical protein